MNVASAYGANQSFQQALPAIASLYEAGGRLQQSGQQHAAGLAAQGQQAIAGLSLRHGEFVADQDQRAQRDLFESTREFELQQQKTELAGWLNSRALSEHEQRRYDAMNNAVAEVYRNDDLSGEEKVNLATKLRTGIDVYEERQRQASAKLKNEQDTHLMDLHTKQVKMNEDGLKYAAQGFPEKVQAFTDPNTGETFHYYIDPTGKPHPVGAKATAGKAGAGEGGLTEEQYLKHRLEVIKSVDAWAAKRDAEAAKAGQSVLTPEERKTNYADAMKAAGMGQSYAEHRGLRGGRRPDDAAGGDQEKPDPVKKIDTAIDDVKQRKDMLPVQREKLVGAMETLKQIVAAYPDVRTAPPQVQQQAQAAAQIIASAPPPRPAATREQRSHEIGGPVGNVIGSHPPPPQETPSWWKRNVVDNIPDLPGI